jgi:hypothetical protein
MAADQLKHIQEALERRFDNTESTLQDVQTMTTDLEQERKGVVDLMHHIVDTDHALRRKKAQDFGVVIALQYV